MGNTPNCIGQVSPRFHEEVWKKPLPKKIEDDEFVRIVVNPPENAKPFAIRMYNWTAMVEKVEQSKDNPIPVLEHNWTPKTTMRDWEILNRTGRKVAKGQGIGVIIVEAIGYAKLILDENRPYGVFIEYAVWNHSDDALEILNYELDLGYDVLYISGDVKSLCVQHLKFDRPARPLEGKVFVPGLDKNLEKYEPVETKTPVEDKVPKKRKVEDGVERSGKRAKSDHL